jgi:chromosome partitioning protein
VQTSKLAFFPERQLDCSPARYRASKIDGGIMQVLVLASQKGGAGKTTLAFHLAVAAETAGAGPVAMLDTDDQGTLTKWWQKRDGNTPKMANCEIGTLATTLGELKDNGTKLVIIDTAGRDNAANRSVIQQADLVVMPVKPSAGDLWALSRTVNVCVELKRPFIFVVCQAVRGTSMTNQALSALSEYGAVAPIIHNRVAYAAAMGIGQTAQEMEPKSPGATEIADLWQFVQKHLRADVHKRKPEGVHTGKRARQKEAIAS